MVNILYTQELFDTELEFLKLEKVEFSGMKGNMLSNERKLIFEQFRELFKEFSDITYEPLNPQDQVSITLANYNFSEQISEFFINDCYDFIRMNITSCPTLKRHITFSSFFIVQELSVQFGSKLNLT